MVRVSSMAGMREGNFLGWFSVRVGVFFVLRVLR